MASDLVLATTAFVGVDTSNPNASSLESFRDPKNHLRGCVSVLTVAQGRAKWNPEKSTEAVAEQYIREIANFPGFKQDSGRTRYQIEAAEWNAYLPKLVDALVDTAPSDRQSILESLQDLEGVIRSSERDFSTSLLFVQVLKKDTDSNNISFSLYGTKLALSISTAGPIQVTNAEANGFYSLFQVDGSYMISDAQRLAQWMSVISVEKWRQANTTRGKRG